MRDLQQLINQQLANTPTHSDKVYQPTSADVPDMQLTANDTQSTTGVQPDNDSTQQLPDYILYDSEIVGYPNENYQAMMYQYALTGVVPIIGPCSVLDVGCGRADFSAVLNQVNSEIGYTGIDNNPLLTQAGVARYDQLDLQSKLINAEFTNFEFDRRYDFVFNIGSLNANYGLYSDSKWAYFDRVLNKSLQLCNTACVFVLLQQHDTTDQYETFPIPNMTDTLLQKGLRFSIDYLTFYPDVYKLVIYK